MALVFVIMHLYNCFNDFICNIVAVHSFFFFLLLFFFKSSNVMEWPFKPACPNLCMQASMCVVCALLLYNDLCLYDVISCVEVYI